ncbi:MAG: rhomboid family intramembrane serine protease [Acidobacteria bacterium]|nr:rhomboid family intramembrane serine protease [Acidobacteriota bacterium]
MVAYRAPYGAEFGIGGRMTPGIKSLIIANVAVFGLQVLNKMTGGAPIENIFGLTPKDVIEGPYLWQLVTYMFLHSTTWLSHLLLNMLMLWMFGTELEKVWGKKLFLKYYFICGIGAGIACMFFYELPTIGASGAVFGVMLAYALTFPNRQILFWFIFPMRAISFVLLCTGIQLFSLLSMQDGVAYSAHLGGMLTGYLYLKRVWRVRQFWRDMRWRMRRRRFRVMRDDDKRYPFH